MGFGVVFYQGPSLLTGDAVVGILTGLEGESLNPKTGAMCQAWILRQDRLPMDAKRQNLDDAVCGDCQLRGKDGKDSGCYLSVWQAPTIVYKSFIAGRYPVVSWSELAAVVEGRTVRLGAYGDPAAIPFEVWRTLLDGVQAWVGYSHQWRLCDQRFKTIVMASVETESETKDAWVRGWRTFRIRRADDPLITLPRRPFVGTRQMMATEFVCPASDEAGHRTTCADCRLCRGTSSPARSVAIVVHGKPSSLKAFGIDAPMFGRSVVKQSGQFDEMSNSSISTEPALLRAKFYRRRPEATV